MTGHDAPTTGAFGLPPGPPWSLDVIADLHAGVFDQQVEAELRPLIEADPDARAILTALDATTASLRSLPPIAVPHGVAARLDAAIRAEAETRAGVAAEVPPQPCAPPLPDVIDLGRARERRRKRGLLAGAGLLTAAAAVFGVVTLSGGIGGGETTGSPNAGGANVSDSLDAPLAVSSTNLGDAFDDAFSMMDYGPLATPDKLDACLTAVRVDPAANEPLGAREVTLDGKPGVLLILPTGTAARFRMIVVEPDCGPGSPVVMADTTVGR